MTGEAQQVEIIKRGRPRPKTPFARKGLYRPEASLDSSGRLPTTTLPACFDPAFSRQPFVAASLKSFPQRRPTPAPTPVREPVEQPSTPPPVFAPHLRPESSPFGSHRFEFASSSPSRLSSSPPHDDAAGQIGNTSHLPAAPVSMWPIPFGAAALRPSPADLDEVGRGADLSPWKAQGLTPREPLFLPDTQTESPRPADPSVMWGGSYFDGQHQLSMASPQVQGGDDSSQYVEQGASDDGGVDKYPNGDRSNGGLDNDPVRAPKRSRKRVHNAGEDGAPGSKKAKAVPV
ncbi:hypothetical protein B0H15DRAFT_945323 [Mycena belliarum]|uniref:Uncharacterized protein n=1 Tax=Mycena belliarum TaxID=1033014 RepID=A0AAD6UJK6_9AGAR|nr:hypothetical protein B0H15DRAFT_945323 [Mycena belliae]